VAFSKQTIGQIAHLARLEISEADAPVYAAKLDRIIEFIDELAAADTSELLPMAHSLEMSQRLRPDEVTESVDRDRYQANAPEVSHGLYLVPRVID